MERRPRPHVGQERDAALVAQQRFRRHQHQRFAERPVHLAAQDVEIVCRRGGAGNLHVVLCAKLEIPLQPGRGMLRPLAFIAMRQQQHEAVHAQPFHFAGSDELVDHDLRAVGEVAELRFPQHQCLGLGRGIAVFKAQHRFFGQQRIHHFEFGLAVMDVVERDVACLGLLIDQGRMALAEGAARRILPRQADVIALVQQGAEGKRFRRGPVEPLAGLEHFRFGMKLAGNGAVQVEIGRHRGQRLADLLQKLVRHRGLAAAVAFRRHRKSGPAAIQPVGPVGAMGFGRLELLIQPLVERRDHRAHVIFGDSAFGHQLRGIKLQRGRMFLDRAVHQRLCEGRFVRFVMAEAAITEHVDHDILVKQLAEFGGDAGAMDHSLRIVAVHMENRRLHHQRHVRTIGRGA